MVRRAHYISSYPFHPAARWSTEQQQRTGQGQSEANQGAMAAATRGGSGGEYAWKLNPWAEPFVPGSWYRAQAEAEAEAEVEDFSPEWWRLVKTSSAFRDRWLQDYCAASLESLAFAPDELFFSPSSPPRRAREEEVEERKEVAGKKGSGGEVAPWGIDKWWRAHFSPPEAPRYAEKAPRRVAAGVRVSPRTIQQPR